MDKPKKILIAEDEIINQLLVKRLLSKAGYTSAVVSNGKEVLKLLENETCDAILTDWMMPEMDGIEMIRLIRKKYPNPPFILMMTSLATQGARQHALDSGADDFITKPIEIDEFLEKLSNGISMCNQIAEKPRTEVPVVEAAQLPPFVAVAIASSTGGPPTVSQVINNLSNRENAAYFIVQHGPDWMLESFADKLNTETQFDVKIAINHQLIQSGTIYIAPGDRHLRIDKNTYRIIIDDGPKENFVRPAADPLFRSVAEAFGQFAIAVVLTGLGRDGTSGSAHIIGAKGGVIVQHPDTAIAPSMPTSVIQSGIQVRVEPLENIASAIKERVFALAALLKKVSAK